MSEEEKEAIKRIEFLINEIKCECDICKHNKKSFKTILNLIEKQAKEIAELKKENNEIWQHLPRLD